jgi:hypothetical protein
MRTAMRRKRAAAWMAGATVILGIGGALHAADRPGLFGRLFSGGASRDESPPSSRPAERPAEPRTPSPARTPTYSSAPASASFQPTPPAASIPAAVPPGTDAPVTGEGAAPRIRPQARVNRAATEADPILTRIALGRSDNGDPFGMFLQVYADGTVIDGEGVHRAGADVMRPLLQALQAPELSRLHGHCGAPPTDFIEQVYVTVYERTKLGGLKANSFSFTGNPQGCDPAVRHLHAAIEALTTRLSSPAHPAAPVASGAPAAAPGVPAPSPPLSLTPGE